MGPVGKATRGVPVFRVIADDLRAGILDGTWTEGERLPSESELLTRYGTARMTVRQAIEVLRTEGLVYTAQGKGAFVRTKPTARRLRGDRFAGGAAGVETDAAQVHLLELAKDKATAEESTRLRLRKGQLVLRRRVGTYAEDGPLEVATHVVSAAVARGTALEQRAAEVDVSACLAQAGHPVARYVEELTARMPTPEEQEELRLSPGTPVLRTVRVALDAAGHPVELCTTVLAADRHVLEHELPG